MMVIIPLILLLSNAVFINASFGYGTEWNYQINSAIGPDSWASNFSGCNGTSQSPINILTQDVIYNKNLGTLKLEHYNQTGGDKNFLMYNHDIDITFKSQVKKGVAPPAVVFKGNTYRLVSFFFHWGSENFKGSEHLVDWQQYAGEMQISHYNTKYDNESHARNKSDGYLIWSHFLKVNSRNFTTSIEFQQLLENFRLAKKCCNETKVEVNLFKLLPKKHNKFYHYNGSFTIPACYAPVTYIVNKDPILLSESQIKLFRQLKDNTMGGIPLVDHFRLPQPLNTRKVESNFDDDGNGKTGAGIAITSCSLPILTVVATLVFVF